MGICQNAPLQSLAWHNGAMEDLSRELKEYAREFGFDLVGISSAEPFAGDQAITLERLRAGLMDGLPWFTESRVKRGCDPQELLPGARSIISVGISYYAPETPLNPPLVRGDTPDNPHFRRGDIGGSEPRAGKVARYAWGDDYHNVMKKRLKALVEGLSTRLGQPIKARWYVDDGPMLDRAVAERAGIGWFGKNTNILSPTHGSWIFLGQVITDLELDPDPPMKKTCGSCVRCIDACPTGAIVAPYVIDNTLCISYQTIENRGPMPRSLRPLMLDWVFGCDICQDVCPVNRKAASTQEEAFNKGRHTTLELQSLLEMTEEEFRQRFRNSPVRRAKRVGLQRNACVALGNSGDPAAVPALARALKEAEPLVRGHAAWALGRIGGEDAIRALEQARALEHEPQVLEEIRESQQEAETPPAGQVVARRAGTH